MHINDEKVIIQSAQDSHCFATNAVKSLLDEVRNLKYVIQEFYKACAFYNQKFEEYKDLDPMSKANKIEKDFINQYGSERAHIFLTHIRGY